MEPQSWNERVILSDRFVEDCVADARQRGINDEDTGKPHAPFVEPNNLTRDQRILWDDAYAESAIRTSYENGRLSVRLS